MSKDPYFRYLLGYLYLFCLLAGLYVRMRARAPSRLGKIPVLSWNQLAFLSGKSNPFLSGKSNPFQSGGSRVLTEITLVQLITDGVLEFNNLKGTLHVAESLTQELSELENLVVCRVRQNPELSQSYGGIETDIAKSLFAQDTMKSLISLSLIVGDSWAVDLKAISLLIPLVWLISLIILIILGYLISGITGLPIKWDEWNVMAKVFDFVMPSFVFYLSIPMPEDRTRWGDHVFFTYKQHLSTNDQRMAMAVGGFEALKNKTFFEFYRLIKKIQSDNDPD
jgi:hypothetical protein